jgi:hypothetical protein
MCSVVLMRIPGPRRRVVWRVQIAPDPHRSPEGSGQPQRIQSGMAWRIESDHGWNRDAAHPHWGQSAPRHEAFPAAAWPQSARLRGRTQDRWILAFRLRPFEACVAGQWCGESRVAHEQAKCPRREPLRRRYGVMSGIRNFVRATGGAPRAASGEAGRHNRYRSSPLVHATELGVSLSSRGGHAPVHRASKEFRIPDMTPWQFPHLPGNVRPPQQRAALNCMPSTLWSR